MLIASISNVAPVLPRELVPPIVTGGERVRE